MDIFSKYARVVHLKDKKGITITNAFQYCMIQWRCAQLENRAKYGLTEEVNFTIVLLKNVKRIIILKHIQYIMKENLFLLKNLLEL